MHVEPSQVRVSDLIAWMEGKEAGVRPVPEPEEELPWVQVDPGAMSRCCWPSYCIKGWSPGSSIRPCRTFEAPSGRVHVARRPTRAVRGCWRPSGARLSGVTWVLSGHRFVDAECRLRGLYDLSRQRRA